MGSSQNWQASVAASVLVLLFEPAQLVVIRPVTKSTSLYPNFKIEYKQVLYGNEKRPGRLTLVVCFFHDLDIATLIASPYSSTLRFF